MDIANYDHFYLLYVTRPYSTLELPLEKDVCRHFYCIFKIKMISLCFPKNPRKRKKAKYASCISLWNLFAEERVFCTRTVQNGC